MTAKVTLGLRANGALLAMALHYGHARHIVVPGHPFVDSKRSLGPDLHAAVVFEPRRSADAE